MILRVLLAGTSGILTPYKTVLPSGESCGSETRPNRHKVSGLSFPCAKRKTGESNNSIKKPVLFIDLDKIWPNLQKRRLYD
jgi:hypothetical protein